VARRGFLRAVLDIALAGDRTVLFSTHITSDLERVADSVAVLKDGCIAFAGGLDALKDQSDKSLEDIFLELHHAE
jgi:ABC-2 type transport system ATP-binding protein